MKVMLLILISLIVASSPQAKPTADDRVDRATLYQVRDALVAETEALKELLHETRCPPNHLTAATRTKVHAILEGWDWDHQRFDGRGLCDK